MTIVKIIIFLLLFADTLFVIGFYGVTFDPFISNVDIRNEYLARYGKIIILLTMAIVSILHIKRQFIQRNFKLFIMFSLFILATIMIKPIFLFAIKP